MGRFLRVPHPSATRVSQPPFDLHVLGMPPAFNLSQDQTLQFNTALNYNNLSFRKRPFKTRFQRDGSLDFGSHQARKPPPQQPATLSKIHLPHHPKSDKRVILTSPKPVGKNTH